LGVLRLAEGKPGAAEQIWERQVLESHRVLDIPMLARTYNNLGVSRARQGDYRGACRALVAAIPYHATSGRRRYLAGTYRNLGLYLAQLGEVETAMAAFERALALASEVEQRDHELETLTDLLSTCLERRTHLSAVPRVLRRAYEILETSAPGELREATLLSFSRLTHDVLAKAGGVAPVKARATARGEAELASFEGRTALRAMLPRDEDSDFPGMLSLRLGEGPRGRHVPPADELASFLMLFTGQYFKSANYTREFAISQERAKRHLRWLCNAGVIERFGSRKASRYALAFHR
jgi:tetratricopeptide (TPR) repeat protein